MHALELEPVGRAASGPVGRVGALGHQAFPAAPAGFAQVGLAVGVAVGAHPQRVAEVDGVAQQPFAGAQRQRGDVVPVEDEDVEQVQVDGDAGGAVRRRGRAGRCGPAGARSWSGRGRTRRSRRRGRCRRGRGRRWRPPVPDRCRPSASRCATTATPRARSWTATARTPSSLRSKIQAGSVKRSWVSVASIGATKPAVVGRTRARSASSRVSRSVLMWRSFPGRRRLVHDRTCGTGSAGYADDHDDTELHRARHEARRRPRGDRNAPGPAERAQRPGPHPQARALERGRPELHRRAHDARSAGRWRAGDGRRRRGAHRDPRRLPVRHTGRTGRPPAAGTTTRSGGPTPSPTSARSTSSTPV